MNLLITKMVGRNENGLKRKSGKRESIIGGRKSGI